MGTSTTCKNCKYWTGDRNTEHLRGSGQCRRHSVGIAGIVPQQSHISREIIPAIVSGWPSADGSEWCGEWDAALPQLAGV